MVVKVRKVGNSKAITIPKDLKVSDDERFEVRREADGTLIFTPAHKNPFEGNWFQKDIKQDDISKDLDISESEWG